MGTWRVAPGGLIHTGGSVVDTASDATQLNTPRLVLPLLGTGRPLTLEGHEGPVLCVSSDGVRVVAIGVPGCGTCRQALVRGCSPTMGQWFLPASVLLDRC